MVEELRAYLKYEKESEGKVVENLSFDIESGCEELKAADVIVSSDNLSPTSDERDGGNYASGVFNTGDCVFRLHERADSMGEAMERAFERD